MISHADLDSGIDRALNWLSELSGSEGQLRDTEDPGAYFKLPAAWALAGRFGEANRSLNWIQERFLDSANHLALPAEVEQERPFNTYDRGWLAWGAMLCERYDIAHGMADDIQNHQDARTGGFFDHRGEREAQAGGLGGMTAGMAGLGLLAAGRTGGAQESARFLADLIDRMEDSHQGMYIYLEITADGTIQLRKNNAAVNFVDLKGNGQRPARFGPAQGMLVRLHRITGDPAPLQTCCRYCDLFLTGRDAVYLSVECHKFTWGLAELFAVTGDTRYREAADKCAEYLVSAQQQNGQWLAETSAPGPGEQSLPLRVGTTCNAVVGLCYHRTWLRS